MHKQRTFSEQNSKILIERPSGVGLKQKIKVFYSGAVYSDDRETLTRNYSVIKFLFTTESAEDGNSFGYHSDGNRCVKIYKWELKSN